MRGNVCEGMCVKVCVMCDEEVVEQLQSTLKDDLQSTLPVARLNIEQVKEVISPKVLHTHTA